MVLEHDKSGGYGKDEGFEILQGGVSGSSDIGMRKQAEDIFNGLGEFPELMWSVSGSADRIHMLTFVQ